MLFAKLLKLIIRISTTNGMCKIMFVNWFRKCTCKIMEMYTLKGDLVKNNMTSLRSKNEFVVLRILYNKTHSVPMTAAACGGTGSSVKRSKNRIIPITSIGLGRHTT